MERNSDTRQIKYEVLRAVSEHMFRGDLNEETMDQIPFQIIPTATPRYRCCVYKEREIIRQRVRLATGRAPIPAHNIEHRKVSNNVIQVIPAACEGCPINRFQVTENCQKCMMKSCQLACAFDAITITPRGAYIDQSKCHECGKCAEACPYHAIADLMRPCKRACEVNAITIGSDKLAIIDEAKCIHCGHCADACPFGAISDMSQITEVIAHIQSDAKVIAVPAPAVEGQFGPEVTIGRLTTALKELGFYDVFEVALGGDAVSYNEAKELIEVHSKGGSMTTSCCPAFVSLIQKHYPQLAARMSNTVSPMVAVVRWVRENIPGAYVVFIGPCMAKKAEAKTEVEGQPDAVLTFEELNAMLDACHIDPTQCPESETSATSFGRRFSGTGGVSEAVMKAVAELGGDVNEIKAKPCSGVKECKTALAIMKAGKLTEDIIEGMICEGGCIAGPGSIATLQQLKQARMRKIKGKDNDNITKMLENQDFMKVNMERK